MIPFETIDMSKYQSAVQHPAQAFRDPDLVSMRVSKNSLGWPAAQSGNFAIIYRLVGRNRITSREEVVAVRCFKKLAPDLAHRYEQICGALDSAAPASKFLLRTRYLAEGIKIDGAWKPVTTLPWVEGVPLDRFFDSAHTAFHKMERLRSQIRDLARELDSAGIAHCDLQHRNVLIDATGTLRLIDYDGMYVSTLKGQRTNELGHPDYQHAGRDDGEIFGPTLDRFSLIVLYLQTYAVARHPDLWAEKERTEGLLLRRQDYEDPDQSSVLASLRSHDDLRPAVDLFRRICVGSLGDVPPLASFIKEIGLAERPVAPTSHIPQPRPAPDAAPSPTLTPPVSPPVGPTSGQSANVPTVKSAPTLYMSVIRAEEGPLVVNVGDEVMVIGQYTHPQKQPDPSGGKSTSLVLRTMGAASFSILVEGPTARQFAALGNAWTVKPGGWLAATGLLVGERGQYIIQVDQIAQLERLSATEAHRRLNMRRWTAKPAHRATPEPRARSAGRSSAKQTTQPPTTPPGQAAELRGGHLIFKDFEQLGRIFGRRKKDGE